MVGIVRCLSCSGMTFLEGQLVDDLRSGYRAISQGSEELVGGIEIHQLGHCLAFHGHVQPAELFLEDVSAPLIVDLPLLAVEPLADLIVG